MLEPISQHARINSTPRADESFASASDWGLRVRGWGQVGGIVPGRRCARRQVTAEDKRRACKNTRAELFQFNLPPVSVAFLEGVFFSKSQIAQRSWSQERAQAIRRVSIPFSFGICLSDGLSRSENGTCVSCPITGCLFRDARHKSNRSFSDNWYRCGGRIMASAPEDQIKERLSSVTFSFSRCGVCFYQLACIFHTVSHFHSAVNSSSWGIMNLIAVCWLGLSTVWLFVFFFFFFKFNTTTFLYFFNRTHSSRVVTYISFLGEAKQDKER